MKGQKIGKGLIGVLLASMVLFSMMGLFQIRPANQMKHPGLLNPWRVPEQGPNHQGASDYVNVFLHSQLCEIDYQIRPANQGYNIPQFFSCA